MNLDSLSFDLTRCTLDTDTPQHRAWVDDAGIKHSLEFIPEGFDWPFDATMPAQARTYFHDQCTQNEGVLLDFEVKKVHGVEVLQGLFKYHDPFGGLGMYFVGILWVPFQDCAFQLNLEALEDGTSGLREATVATMQRTDDTVSTHAQHMEELHEHLRASTLSEHPADSPEHDALFPEHPLTLLRSRLHTICASIRITLPEGASSYRLPPATQQTRAWDRFQQGYYITPDPQIAAKALSFVLQNNVEDLEKDIRNLYVYQFCRAAQETPEALDLFRNLEDEYEGFALTLLQSIIIAAEHPEITPNPLDAPLLDPTTLDWCWAEFLISGDLTPIRHIAGVLDWPDTVHTRIVEKLEELSGFSHLIMRRTLLRNLDSLSIEVDPKTHTVKIDNDLDLFWADLLKDGIEVRALLPLDLSEEDLIHIAIKSAAFHSLLSQSKAHPNVAECAYEEACLGTSRGHLTLRAYLEHQASNAASSHES